MSDVTNFDLFGQSIDVKDPIARRGFLKGQKCLCFGDSTAANPGSYINILKENYGVEIENKAVGGTSLTASLPTLLTENIDEYDTVIINYTINDWQASVPLKFAYGTTLGYNDSLISLIDFILSKGKEAYVILPWFCYSKNFPNYGVNEALCNLPGYIDSAIEICKEKHVPYVNLYTCSGINENNYASLMENSDGIYVHGLETVNNRVAALLYSGIYNNGKCHECKYCFEPMLTNNGFNSYEEINSSLEGIAWAVNNGQNIQSRNTMTISTCYINSNSKNDYMTIEGIAVVNSTFQISLWSENVGYKLVKRINTDTWRYGLGLYRFSIPIGDFKKFYLAFDGIENANYSMCTRFYTDNQAATLSLRSGSRTGVILGSNVELGTYTQSPVVTITKDGYDISPFAVKSIAENSKIQVAIFELSDYVKAAIVPNIAQISNDGGNTFTPGAALIYASNKQCTLTSEGNYIYLPGIHITTAFC